MLNIGIFFKKELKNKETIIESLYRLGEKVECDFCELIFLTPNSQLPICHSERSEESPCHSERSEESFCHSERSEESQRCFVPQHDKGCFVPQHDKKDDEFLTPNSKKRRLNFILSFGGDGTMLSSIDYAIKYNAPVLGVNLGKLGFLTDSKLSELEKDIQALINNKYRLESRMLIDVKVIRNKEIITGGTALNDAVIFNSGDGKLIDLKLYTDKQFVYESRCDGMVISTPTGSTAYSLSAGGPIISPAMQAIIVTPLNPHILTIRPMVFAHNETIEVRIPKTNNVFLQIDGKNKGDLLFGDKIVIKKSKQIVNFVKITKKSFYNILRKKLQMGKR